MLRQTPTTVEVGAATTSASVVKMPASIRALGIRMAKLTILQATP